LKSATENYRKLRNTFRYLLGALDGFSEAEKLPVAEMPELERYVLALLAKLDGTLRQAVVDYDFNTYVRALTDFCNEDLSAFFFDIRKDSLYCDAADSPKRRAYRTVLDVLFHALVRWAAPVLVFTAEEVWGTRYPEGGSVHLLEWPEGDAGWAKLANLEDWDQVRKLRAVAFVAAENARREKVIGSSLEAKITFVPGEGANQSSIMGTIDQSKVSLSELFITGEVNITQDNPFELREVAWSDDKSVGAVAHRTGAHKCGRCWRHLPEVAEDGDLCSRCDQVVAGMDGAA
jgi:isoleucyl-tRNA synthetase